MENLIEELTKVNPANLSEEGLKLFNKINEIIDRNRELEKQMGKDLDVVYLQGVYNERDRWKSKVRELYNHYKDTGYYELESVLQELLEERN